VRKQERIKREDKRKRKKKKVRRGKKKGKSKANRLNYLGIVSSSQTRFKP